MVVGARRASLSISQSTQLLGFSHITISMVHKEWCEKGKTSSMRQSCGRKCLDARGQRRMGRLIQADRRTTLTEITTRYNPGVMIPVLCFPCLVWTLVISCFVPCFAVLLVDESLQVFLISPTLLISCLVCLSVYLNFCASVVGCRFCCL